MLKPVADNRKSLSRQRAPSAGSYSIWLVRTHRTALAAPPMHTLDTTKITCTGCTRALSRPTSSTHAGGKQLWHCASATSSKINRRVKSYPVRPIRVVTPTTNQPCTDSCKKAVNSNAAGLKHSAKTKQATRLCRARPCYAALRQQLAAVSHQLAATTTIPSPCLKR